MKKKRLLKFLLVVCLMTFISVKASGIPNVTITDVSEYKNEENVVIKKNSEGIYVLSGHSGYVNYEADAVSPDYCLAVKQREYTVYDHVGKVSMYGFGTYGQPKCEDYDISESLSAYFSGETKNIEMIVGFVKKSEWEALKATSDDPTWVDWEDLELYNYKSVVITGVPEQYVDNAEYVSFLDKDKKEVKDEGDRDFTITSNQKYYARLKLNKTGVTQVKYNYSLNEDYENPIEGTVSVSNGYVDVPITLNDTVVDEGVIHVEVLNVGEDYEWSSSVYLYYTLSTKRVANLEVTYKSGSKALHNYGFTFDSRDYNSSKPITLNISLKNFKNSEYNAVVKFVRTSWNDEKDEYDEKTLWSKNVKLTNGKTNNVSVDYVPVIDTTLEESWEKIVIEVDGSISSYEYEYYDGIISSALYDTKGNIVLNSARIGVGATGNMTIGGSYYTKSPAFDNNIYVMYGGSRLDESKKYTYKIFTIKDKPEKEEGTKVLVTSGSYTGKEFNEKNIFANVKVPTGITKDLRVVFELYDSNNKLVYVNNNYIGYENKSNIHTYITDTAGVDAGAYGYYEYVTTGLDYFNIRLVGVNYDESKTYGYLIINEYSGKYVKSGTISGKELNAGKTIKIDSKIDDFAPCDISIYELGEDIIRNYDSKNGSFFNIDVLSKDDYSKLTAKKHFETNPTKVLELMKNTNANTAKIVGASESTTPSNPSTPTETTTPTVTTPNLDEFKVTSVGTKNVKLSWNKVSEAKGYIVYGGTNSKKLKKLTTTKNNTTLTYNNKKLKPGTKYYYKVVAYKVVKKKNKTIVTSKVINTVTTPSAPKVKVKGSTYNSVTVNVAKSKGATRYVVERSTDKKTYSVITEMTKYGNYKDTTVNTGTKYYYRVKACNNTCSGYSKVVNAKPSLKKTTLKVKSSTKGTVKVTLPKVSGADGYVIVKSTKKTKGFTEVANVDYATKVFDEVNLKSKKTYYYKVRAYRLVNEKPVYSAYSKVIKIKVK